VTTRNIEGEKSILSLAAPFVAPFLAFMLFLSAEGYFPDQHYLLYPFKSLLVAGVLAYFWRALPSLTPSSTLLSVIIGILGVAIWVGLDSMATRLDVLLEETYNSAVQAIGMTSWKMELDGLSPPGRNPFLLYPASEAWVLFAFRVAGISLVVPVMEELFWRGFLMRWLIKEDFTAVPLGTYQHASFWITTAFFAMVHGSEWPLAVLVGVLYGAWFVRTKRLGDIMLAHGVTNFLLALYCLFTNDWHFLSMVTPVHK
jgi:membrane protease YdiL (CAAX protease family)